MKQEHFHHGNTVIEQLYEYNSISIVAQNAYVLYLYGKRGTTQTSFSMSFDVAFSTRRNASLTQPAQYFCREYVITNSAAQLESENIENF